MFSIPQIPHETQNDMTESRYTAVPRNEHERQEEPSRGGRSRTGSSLIFLTLGLFGLAVLSFGLGFGVAWEWASSRGRCQSQSQSQTTPDENGLLLPPQSFILESQYKSSRY